MMYYSNHPGNYVISGGAENVLVLWQLDTSAKQFLPHLSAAIENIAVAPSGSSYAVHNSNNSVTVISTLDFQPTFHVSGIQLPVRKDLAIPDVARVTTKNGLDPISRRPPITTSLSQPGCLLVAVPAISTSPTDGASCASAVYLQTYDIRSGSSVSKQALTRTKLTDRTTGPEGNVIQEPDVVLLRTSHDGKWLATADEWAPPTRDYKPTSVDEAATTSAVQSRIEVYLKFWLWNDGPKIWELATRIDMPHPPDARNSGSLGRILDLVEEPSRLGFITLGDDATVRVWKPRARSRNGDEIRRKAGQPSVNWSCRVVAPLPSLDFGSSRIKAQGITRIAVSEDGSLTVVGQHSPVGSVIHLVDTLSGEIRSSISGLFTGSLSGLGIIDQFLIVLSDELIVWDMVHGRIRYGLPLKPQAERNWKASDGTRRSLAFNWKEKTFAVSTPELSNNKSKPSKMGSQVTVFNPTTPTPIFSTRLPQKLKALLPSNDDKGYVTISSTVEVRRLLPRHQLPLMDASPAGEELPALAGLENIYGHGKALPASNETANHQTLATNIPKETPISITAADDKIVVRQHQLADIFGIGQPFALPPVTDLFERVAGLFSRKITPAA
jgi:NET1-associated nuclear protein 1 (U3 small nucleolar RNA-associated protein 17)